MAKHTLKILWCSHRKIFKVCLAILQHYAWKAQKLKSCYFRKKFHHRCLKVFQISLGVLQKRVRKTKNKNVKVTFFYKNKSTIDELAGRREILETLGLYPANTQRWFNVDICWNNVISMLIQRRFVNVDSLMKFKVETTLILRWL